MAWVVAAIQFTNALEYMAVSPLFPQMAREWAVPPDWAGYAAGIYTVAAIASGLLAYTLVDRIRPQRLLLAALAVLTLCTLAMGMGSGFASLMLWRGVAGLTGGITMGSASAILLLHARAEERPALLAITVAAFSAVSIVGTPVVLWIAEVAGWRWSFRFISLCCLLCWIGAAWRLPAAYPQGWQATPQPRLARPSGTFLRHAGLNALSQLPALLLIPLLAPMLIALEGGSTRLPLLYLLGGVAGLVASKLAGRTIARWGAVPIFGGGLALLAATILACAAGLLSGGWFMGLFMACTYAALVAAAASSAAYPSPAERPRFSMLQSTLMHVASSVAFFGSAWLSGLPAMQAHGYPALLLFSAVLALGLACGSRILLRHQA